MIFCVYNFVDAWTTNCWRMYTGIITRNIDAEYQQNVRFKASHLTCFHFFFFCFTVIDRPPHVLHNWWSLWKWDCSVWSVIMNTLIQQNPHLTQPHIAVIGQWHCSFVNACTGYSQLQGQRLLQTSTPHYACNLLILFANFMNLCGFWGKIFIYN